MAKVPPPAHTVESLIDAKMVAESNNDFREHLGCSLIGHPCDRWLWLSFRWAVKPDFKGRTLRIFRRGQNEEDIIVSDLRRIGVDIRHTGRDQKRISFGWHTGGSVDGIIERGVPGAEATRHIAEFKTANAKSFAKTEKEGVAKANPQHYVQMQLYMLALDIERALYLVVCKDDDRIYSERVKLDREFAEKYRHRAIRIVQEDRMPPPLSTDPSWYQCRFCDGHDLCHGSKQTKQVNCRTCAHSTVRQDDIYCERWEDAVPTDVQREGCASHVLHPDLVQWPMKEHESDWSVVYVIDGKDVVNGEDGYHSTELVANAAFAATGVAEGFREMGGRIVG